MNQKLATYRGIYVLFLEQSTIFIMSPSLIDLTLKSMNLKAVLFQFLPTVPTKKVIEVSSHTDTHTHPTTVPKIKNEYTREFKYLLLILLIIINTYYVVILCGVIFHGCIDRVEVILSDWPDTGDGSENLRKWFAAAGLNV